MLRHLLVHNSALRVGSRWQQLIVLLQHQQRHQHTGDHAAHSGTSGRFKSIEQTILRETRISRDHLTPEIALHLITPECRLFHEPIPTLDTKHIFVNDPFWAFYWPGGQAISRYILDNPTLVAGKSVLDVGSGCGASAIAALMCKAKYVVANDIDEAAGCAALLNAKLNNVNINVNFGVDVARLRICVDDLIAAASRVPEDIIFLGDVFYDEAFAATLHPWLEELRIAGKQIFVGDPGRHGLTAERRKRMQRMAKYELTESGCIENNGFKFVNVWQFK